ncbi:MAG: NUDIX hydrolase [Microcystis panniformis Mp_MB_F_20051200_S9]|uniref:NUDIX hydrolase n=1 Tax=Microcystis panniformis Mp_MB_F_20051200_S9 TaxID=2486223 RepID=A0A552PLY0_9CHRO|nr:MAG: NUDIX hydrolase [Microcystis panniformis Mp_GB_SS_20050300_S99]TRV47777.1 MAG: NUDIX hydrolase [Microcystis panniformis Mp_MB_F_20080800_S26D]TRV47981.1 MAG: NUDIX hydrolase [Microcystis panniformis Mp_GB_SS_20050300_S99D]TRV57949.1 MAG: NUDIX hydrolase [Microcystis panniformis Mp_MB_F_20051200_S9]TRV63963.1 MAG: NUDIX hydrolase [Microcystis panniformis Mp_MB_F_20080800_S26]TRV65694.1 MAG: NUDIX hydrolase [Microcystis panniformis Mp_MB_F_20051200_S9D]TRV69573.1 MAG: NUDIX hydrolase [M
MQQPSGQPWPVNDRFLELRSQWMTLIGEHLQDDRGQLLEYWRVEKADSVIVLPIQNSMIRLPDPSYRPGLGQTTLDFPGGRISEGQDHHEAALMTLKRELGIEATAVTRLTPLNSTGWSVNSSFSNQKLYGFIADIDGGLSTSEVLTYPANSIGVSDLLKSLTCLQCRSVLLEWWLNQTER